MGVYSCPDHASNCCADWCNSCTFCDRMDPHVDAVIEEAKAVAEYGAGVWTPQLKRLYEAVQALQAAKEVNK